MVQPHRKKLAMKLANTHYGVLNVKRDAPPEVIRATYRALCRKYHPDLNADASDTTRIMAIINVSYDILSSSSRRRAYDDWLAEQESLHGRIAAISPGWRKFTAQAMPTMPRLAARTTRVVRYVQAATSHICQHTATYALGSSAMALTMAAILNPGDEPVQPEFAPLWAAFASAAQESHQMPTPFPHLALVAAPTTSSGAASSAGYVRSDHAPNGQAWPTKASYLKNTPILHDNGNAVVSVENVTNSSDVHVKLVALRGLREYPVREFYIPANGRFTLKNLSPGLYDVRYRDLDNGRLARSEEFMAEERDGIKGTGQVNATVRLDKIQKNRVDIFGLLETEF